MPDESKTPPSTEVVEVERVRPDCCPSMKLALDYANRHNPDSKRVAAGLQVAHVYNAAKGGYQWSPVVHVLPARGRGKAKTRTEYLMVLYCPFCGKRQEGRPRGD
jgi:hypothetical protein